MTFPSEHLAWLFRQMIEEKFGPWCTPTGDDHAGAIVELMAAAYIMGREDEIVSDG
jgi:hypothetical protein